MRPPHLTPTSAVACVALTLALAAGCGPADLTAAPEQAAPDDAPASPEATSSPASAASPSPSASPSSSASPAAPSDTTPAEPTSVEGISVSTVASGLEAPWDVAFVPDGSAYVTERDSGRLLRWTADGAIEEVRTFAVDNESEGGLLGLAASPNFADDGVLYVFRSTPQGNEVLRFTPDGTPEVVLGDIPHAPIHNGGRIAFGPDGNLYVAVGDGGDQQAAQDEDSLAGKILRVSPDGTIPTDNPSKGSPVWASGLRDPQGLTWDDGGALYVSEFGPDVDDEINVVVPGGNYGWPDVTGIGGRNDAIDPIFVQQPPEASWSGIQYVSNSAIDAWDGSLLVAALRGRRLWRVPVDDPTKAEDLFVGEFGRLRTAVQAPDGSIWVLTSNRDGRGTPGPDDDRILRLAPTAG